MKKRLLALPLMVVVAFLSACALTPPGPAVDFNPDYNFAAVHTFAFAESSNFDSSSLIGSRIEKAIEDEMGIKGLKKTRSDKADILVRFAFSQQEKQDFNTYNYHTSPGRLWLLGHPIYSSEVDVMEYTENKLVIEVIDPKSQKAVWEGVRTYRDNTENLSPPEKEAQLRVLISNILGRLPAPSI